MRPSRRSRGSASSDPPDAYTYALVLLGQRELSEVQLRTRLARRGCPAEDIDQAVTRLTADGTIDDRRVAAAAARLEASVRRRGPSRVRQRLLTMGLAPEMVSDAVANVFDEVDASALLDDALSRRLRGKPVGDLDDKARARIIRALVAQGFSLGEVLKRMRR